MIQKIIEFFSKNQKYFTIGGACLLLVLNGQQRTRIASLQKELKAKELIHGGDIRIDSLMNVNDSLQTEMFILQNQNNRYQLGMEYLYEIDPKRGSDFEEYINNNTE